MFFVMRFMKWKEASFVNYEKKHRAFGHMRSVVSDVEPKRIFADL